MAMSSVSRVLSGHPDVSEPMRTAGHGSGGRARLHPRHARPRASEPDDVSPSVSWSPTSPTPCSPGRSTGAERRLRSAGYSLLLTDSEGSPPSTPPRFSCCSDGGSTACCCRSPTSRTPRRPRRSARSTSRSCSSIAISQPERSAPRALFDHRRGMRQAGKHLVELGHRDVALIIGGPRRPARERRTGLE